MTKISRYRVLISGVFSPLLAVLLYSAVYSILTSRSADLEKDWMFRLSAATVAMIFPFLITLVLFIKDYRRHTLSLSGKIGFALAVLSLGLAWSPLSDARVRSKQVRNLSMRDVPAPTFETIDILGKAQKLGDQKGKVVLVSRWATWCGPCREEMPKLDRMYRQRKDLGLIVFGLSDEDIKTQRKYLEKVPVDYPLLVLSPGVTNFYRDIARYPAIFLIDRHGRLQPAPGPDEPFDKVEATVKALLDDGGD